MGNSGFYKASDRDLWEMRDSAANMRAQIDRTQRLSNRPSKFMMGLLIAGLGLLCVAGMFVEYWTTIWLGNTVFNYAGGFSPWTVFGLSVGTFLALGFSAVLLVVSLGAYCAFRISNGKETLKNEIRMTVVALPFVVVACGILSWTAVSFFK